MKIKLAGHETFYPREHWLYKGINEREARLAVKDAKLRNGFFKDQDESNDDYPTDYMGVGVNMVKAIRHWVNVFRLLGLRQFSFLDSLKMIYFPRFILVIRLRTSWTKYDLL